MKPAKKKTAACPAALRLEAMLPVDAGILSQQADDWTDRSVERGTVGPLAAEHALWHNCLFRNVTFTDCRLHGAQLSDIRFEGCDLSNLALDGAALNRVEFVGCKLLGAALPDATLNHVRLGRCNGRYLNLSGSRLRPGTLHGVRPDGSGAERLPPRRRRPSRAARCAAPSFRIRRCAASTSGSRSSATCG